MTYLRLRIKILDGKRENEKKRKEGKSMDFLSTFLNVLIIVVLAIPGYFLRKVKLFPETAASIALIYFSAVSDDGVAV